MAIGSGDPRTARRNSSSPLPCGGTSLPSKKNARLVPPRITVIGISTCSFVTVMMDEAHLFPCPRAPCWAGDDSAPDVLHRYDGCAAVFQRGRTPGRPVLSRRGQHPRRPAPHVIRVELYAKPKMAGVTRRRTTSAGL